jgi:hypothetical protein
VQKGAGVAGAIGANASQFQRPPVIAESGHGPADDGDPDDSALLHGGQRKLVTDDGPVVTVVLLYEGIGLGQ